MNRKIIEWIAGFLLVISLVLNMFLISQYFDQQEEISKQKFMLLNSITGYVCTADMVHDGEEVAGVFVINGPDYLDWAACMTVATSGESVEEYLNPTHRKLYFDVLEEIR